MSKKPKKCQGCGEPFYPRFLSTEKVCGVQCAMIVGKKKNEQKKDQEWRKERKQRKEAIKTRSDYAKEAQTAFNAYIRARDKGKPCISCDKPDNGQHQRHASHYRSVGACSNLRYNTYNVHSSCATCNTQLSGNLIEYRIRLIKKLGIDRVEWLESQNELVRYDVEYLKRLKKIFSKRARRLNLK